eukprot:RCo005163
MTGVGVSGRVIARTRGGGRGDAAGRGVGGRGEVGKQSAQPRGGEELLAGQSLRGLPAQAAPKELLALWAQGVGKVQLLLPVCNRKHCSDRRGAQVQKGRPARAHFHNGCAQAPDVRRSAVTSLLDDLRSHPVSGAAEGVLVGVGEVEKLLRGAKVCELEDPLVRDQDVCPLQIPVDNLLLVQVPQPLHDLQGVLPDHRLRQGPKLLQHSGQRASGHQLHINVQRLVDQPSAEVADDIGVAEWPHDLNLADQARKLGLGVVPKIMKEDLLYREKLPIVLSHAHIHPAEAALAQDFRESDVHPRDIQLRVEGGCRGRVARRHFRGYGGLGIRASSARGLCGGAAQRHDQWHGGGRRNRTVAVVDEESGGHGNGALRISLNSLLRPGPDRRPAGNGRWGDVQRGALGVLSYLLHNLTPQLATRPTLRATRASGHALVVIAIHTFRGMDQGPKASELPVRVIKVGVAASAVRGGEPPEVLLYHVKAGAGPLAAHLGV